MFGEEVGLQERCQIPKYIGQSRTRYSVLVTVAGARALLYSLYNTVTHCLVGVCVESYHVSCLGVSKKKTVQNNMSNIERNPRFCVLL